MATLPGNISILSAPGKVELVVGLWEDLATHPQEVSAAQAEELDRRIATFEKDPQTGSTWAQVRAGLPKR